jgi:uncharacterized protein (DUF1501 family)
VLKWLNSYEKLNDLGVNRQIFFCQLGGFDTHQNQPSSHNSLLIQVSQAMRAFYDEIVAQGLADKVVQFWMTDFNKTFNPSGSGSSVGTDHAWGNHLIVIGDAVTASNFYGMNTSNGHLFQHLPLMVPTMLIPAQMHMGIGFRQPPSNNTPQL